KEAAKFVGDFKSLSKEADASLAKHKILELEIKRLLKAVVSQDIISVVQITSVVDTSDLQTELERTKERFENCIIKKETEYAKLWNDWYKKCDECKYDKISYDKAYKDMQQKIERLQAQLRDLKGKNTNNACVSNTLNPLSQKLKNANVELEFQVLNYARENAHLKATYKNLFDSISVSRVQTETKIASLQNELQCNIYKNAKLRTQLFKKVSDQKDNTQDSKFQVLNYARENAHLKATYKNLFDFISVSRAQTKTTIASLQNELQSNIYKNVKLRTQLFKKVFDQKDKTQDTSANTKFTKQTIMENLPKVGKTNALSNLVTSNSVSTPLESKGVNNDKLLDKRLNKLTMMVLMRQTESCDMLVHMVMIDMKLLVVETEIVDITVDDVNTVFCSTDVGRSKQVDL
nr:hypothetical protein [Tanacetum cinerariifolium]